MADYGVDDKFMKELSKKLHFGGEVIHSPLDHDTESMLQEAVREGAHVQSLGLADRAAGHDAR